MAQINVQVRDSGNFRQSKAFADDLTLRSVASKLIIINSDESASNFKVFRIRKPNSNGSHSHTDDVSSITELGDAVFNNIDITGDTNLEGFLAVEGSISTESSLVAQGIIQGYGGLKIYDNSELHNDLQVYGSSNLLGNLEVDLDIANHGNILSDGNLNISGSVDVSGFTYLKDSLEVDNSIMVHLNLDVGNNAAIDGTLDVSGRTHITNQLEIDASTQLNGTLVVEQTSQFKNTASGYFDINKGFKIDGVSTSALVSAPNLNNLTGGSNADGLHAHAGDNVSLNTSAFNKILNAGDNTSQKAFDKLDELFDNSHTVSGILTFSGAGEAKGNFNLNTGFKIENIPTGLTVTSSSLDNLTNGSTVDTLHKHKANQDVDIVVASLGGDFTDLWSAYNASSSGDVILVANDQTTDVQRILDKEIQIIFKPGVKINCSTNLTSSVISFGSSIITKNLKLVLSQAGTTSIGFEFNGDMSYHENIKLVMNDLGMGTGSVSEAYVLNLNKQGNFVKGLTHQISGSIVTAITDNSTNSSNDIAIREIS